MLQLKLILLATTILFVVSLTLSLPLVQHQKEDGESFESSLASGNEQSPVKKEQEPVNKQTVPNGLNTDIIRTRPKRRTRTKKEKQDKTKHKRRRSGPKHRKNQQGIKRRTGKENDEDAKQRRIKDRREAEELKQTILTAALFGLGNIKNVPGGIGEIAKEYGGLTEGMAKFLMGDEAGGAEQMVHEVANHMGDFMALFGR